MKLLRDTIKFDYTVLKMEDNRNGDFIVEGLLSVAGELNGNKRIYKEEIWRRIVEDVQLQTAIKEGEVMGELEHPNDGMTHLGRASHIVTEMWMDGNKVYTKCKLLDNPDADRLKDIFRKGGKPGISTRGRGTSYTENGIEYVNDDYVFETYDFVNNPSVSVARPKPVSESVTKKPQSRQSNKQKGTRVMLKDIEKIENRVSDIGILLNKKNVSKADRKRYINDLRECQIALDKIASEDSTTASVVQEVQSTITKIKSAAKNRKTTKSSIKESKRKRKNEMDDMSDVPDDEEFEMDDMSDMPDEEMGSDDSDMGDMDLEMDDPDMGMSDEGYESDDEDDLPF